MGYQRGCSERCALACAMLTCFMVSVDSTTTSCPDPATCARGLAWLLALGLMTASSVVSAAKMYHWVDADTGSVQLAGNPPPWYRSALSGPRVRVYEDGKVIDDTAFAAPLSAPADGTASVEPVPSDPAGAPAEDRGHTVPAEPRPVTATDQAKAFKALLEAWEREQAYQVQPAAPTSAPDSVTEPSR